MVSHAVMQKDLRVAGRVLAVLAALSLTCAVAMPGQAPVADAGLLRWYQGTREIGRETFRRSAQLFETETEVPMLHLKLHYRSEYDAGGRLSRFEARLFDSRTDTLVRTYTATVQGDTLRIRQVGGHPADTSWVKAAHVEAVTPAQSLAAMLELAERAGGAARSYVVWSPESNDTLSFAATPHGDSLEVRLGPFTLTARLGPAGRVDRLEIPMQRMRAERWSGAGDTLPPLEGAVRPPADYSAHAGSPFTAQEVRVPVHPAAGDTFSLGCTLTLPRLGRAPFPVVLTITGSGLEDRDENLWPLVPGYRPFRQVAERVASAGIATLRCDDRSFGASTGDARHATTSDFAEDACAEVAWLQARPEIDRTRIALVGHSEGGVIAPMVAVMHPSVAAVVLMAGTAKNGVAVLKDQVAWPIESASGISPERKAQLRAEAIASVDNDSTTSDWMRFFRQYDPLPTARRVHQPALILQGALDRQVTAGQADTLGAAMRAGGNRDVTVRVFPGLSHLFVPSPTDGSPSEYASLTDVSVSRDVLDTMANWLVQKLHPATGGRRPGR
ncbi:MAG: alpha/beta fold hydrolase [Gemmatimonadales bacterium]|jgi:dienelactone hydrolase